jgi:2-isopropylmalate synthase
MMSKQLKGDNVVEVYDTTLRDGTQGEGIWLSCDDKLRIAKRLDQLGVTYIEGGWPGSNPKDVEFFERAKDREWENAWIAAFGSTRRKDIAPEDDGNIQALIQSGAPVCTVFGKTWTLHVTDVLRTTLKENLNMIEDSVAYLISQGRKVVYDAEHFFDGYKADPGYALETLAAAARGGADLLVLCDTNGGSMPWEIQEIIRTASKKIDVRLGIHAHNDGGCGVANSIAAVKEGAIHVQGTSNGYGERCGNANLCVVVPDLELKLGKHCLPEGNLRQMYDFAHFVAEVANVSPNEREAYVGRSAFAHKGGVHVAALRRNIDSYQHVDPELVGNEMRVVVSELSGRGNLMSKAEDFGFDVENQEDVAGVLKDIKDLESRGFSFEAAEASVALLLKRADESYVPPFELVDYTTYVEHRQGRGMVTEATVKVRVNGNVFHTAAEGNGPVNALDNAFRKALTETYPEMEQFHLVDYKVRILDSQSATGALTRVLIDTQSEVERWSTVGASTNIIEASWQALADSFEYGLLRCAEELAPQEIKVNS